MRSLCCSQVFSACNLNPTTSRTATTSSRASGLPADGAQDHEVIAAPDQLSQPPPAACPRLIGCMQRDITPGRGAADLANDRVEAVIRGEIELHSAGTKRRLTG
jgi:hypothetical protein